MADPVHSCSSIRSLPPEILWNICGKLEEKDLGRLRRVCKLTLTIASQLLIIEYKIKISKLSRATILSFLETRAEFVGKILNIAEAKFSLNPAEDTSEQEMIIDYRDDHQIALCLIDRYKQDQVILEIQKI